MWTKLFHDPFRSIWSQLYRMFLAVASVLAIWEYPSKQIDAQWFALGVGLWLVIYFRFIRKSNKPWIRMVYDYALIYVTIYFSDAESALKISFVMLPILNQHNHTAKAKTFKRSLLFLILWSVAYFYLNKSICASSLLFYVFVSTLIVIDWIDSFIGVLSSEFEKLTYEILDSSDEGSSLTDRLIIIRETLMKTMGGAFPVEHLYLLEKSEKWYSLKAGTRFMPGLAFRPGEKVKNETPKETMIQVETNQKGRLNDECCRGIYTQRNKIDYLFVLEFKDGYKADWLTSVVGPKILIKAIHNLIRVYRRKLYSRMLIRKTNDDFVKNSTYIQSVRAAAHFIKNNTNPFLTIHEMLTEYLGQPEDGLTVVTDDDLQEANAQLGITQKKIKEYVDRILNSPRKDIFEEKEEKINGVELIKSIQGTIEQNHAKVQLIVNYDQNSLDRLIFLIKQMSLSVLAENLIKNAVKYSTEKPIVECDLGMNGFVFSIRNKVKQANRTAAVQFIKDVNSSTREEIVKRQGEGLWLIRKASDNLSAKLDGAFDTTKDELIITFSIGGTNE